jgi:hypothetical protein
VRKAPLSSRARRASCCRNSSSSPGRTDAAAAAAAAEWAAAAAAAESDSTDDCRDAHRHGGADPSPDRGGVIGHGWPFCAGGHSGGGECPSAGASHEGRRDWRPLPPADSGVRAPPVGAVSAAQHDAARSSPMAAAAAAAAVSARSASVTRTAPTCRAAAR